MFLRRLWPVQFGQKSDGASGSPNQKFLLLELHDGQEPLLSQRKSFRQPQSAGRTAPIKALPDACCEDSEQASRGGPETLTTGWTHAAFSQWEYPFILLRAAAVSPLSRRVVGSVLAPQGWHGRSEALSARRRTGRFRNFGFRKQVPSAEWPMSLPPRRIPLERSVVRSQLPVRVILPRSGYPGWRPAPGPGVALR